MIPIERTKVVNMIAPRQATMAAATVLTVTNAVDTAGWGHLRVLMQFGVASVALSAAPKLQSSSASAGTYTDITSAVLSAAPTATADNYIYAIDVDLTKGSVHRWVKVLATHGTDETTGTGVAVLGILSRSHAGAKSGAAEAATNGVGLFEKTSA